MGLRKHTGLRTGPTSLGAITRVLGQGIPLPPQPTDQLPELPRDLTELGEGVLMEIWSTFTSWTDFLGAQVACAYADEKSLLRRMERYEQRALLSDEKVTRARAEVKASDEYERLVTEWLDAEAYRKLVEALFNNCDRDAALLSRELTRRSSDVKSRQRTWQP